MFPALTTRAAFLAKARAFFAKRNILEVDVPALSRYAAIDVNIDVIEAFVTPTEQGFLHTSPEYAMKQLLAAGAPDIYFLGHVFRKGEIGHLHNPEFTMAEWYRLGISFVAMIAETAEFLSLFFNTLPLHTLSYRAAFATHLDLDYTAAPLSQLQKLAQPYLPPDTTSWNRSDYLHLLLTHHIEPHLGKSSLTVLTDYPPSESALARTTYRDGELVAERFEIYYQGIELANGYHELANPTELQNRLTEENRQRLLLGKPAYPLDELFLHSLSSLPPCCGVSVGFDRALMLHQQAHSLSQIIPFTWMPRPPAS